MRIIWSYGRRLRAAQFITEKCGTFNRLDLMKIFFSAAVCDSQTELLCCWHWQSRTWSWHLGHYALLLVGIFLHLWAEKWPKSEVTITENSWIFLSLMENVTCGLEFSFFSSLKAFSWRDGSSAGAERARRIIKARRIQARPGGQRRTERFLLSAGFRHKEEPNINSSVHDFSRKLRSVWGNANKKLLFTFSISEMWALMFLLSDGYTCLNTFL